MSSVRIDTLRPGDTHSAIFFCSQEHFLYLALMAAYAHERRVCLVGLPGTHVSASAEDEPTLSFVQENMHPCASS